MIKLYKQMPHLNGSIMCAIDFETTGLDPFYHDPIQFAAVPLDGNLQPMEGVTPFNRFIQPKNPDRATKDAMRVHGFSLDWLMANALPQKEVEDLFLEWFEKFDLPKSMVLCPLAHNYSFENGFLKAWIGHELTHRIFHAHARDAMSYALAINDRAFYAGERIPFKRVRLRDLCEHFHITNPTAHDALQDCYTEAEVYRALLKLDMLNG